METININKPNTQSVGSNGTDSLTLGGVGKTEGGSSKKNPYWTGPLSVVENIPTITRNIDCLMSKYLRQDGRVPRSIDYDDFEDQVTYTYEIHFEDQVTSVSQTFSDYEDVNFVTLCMVGRLLHGLLVEKCELNNDKKLRSMFDKTVGRMGLEEDEVTVVRNHFVGE